MAVKNEAKIRFSAETKEFDKGIKDANSTLSTLRNELKLNEAQMRNNGVSIDGLREKQQNLAAQMEAAQDKTKALSDKLAVAVEVFGENSVEADKLRNQLINAQTAEVKLQGAIDRCNAEMERQERAAKQAESASGKLTGEIEDQQGELKKLKDAYVDAVLEFGEGSDEAKELADKIDDLSGELKDNKKRMNDAARAADELDRSLDDAEDRDAGGFTVLKGAMADLVSEGIQAVIGSVGDMMSYFAGLPQETMELRQDFGTLTTAFDNVGLGAETATETWKELYKVFGEDDRAIETANNIARIADSEEELSKWVTITTGIWGTYQDSLPVEGLAEAAAETAKTGTVTGGLADALNWSSEAAAMFADYMSEDVVTAEDAFNVALSECSTEAERQALITDTLTKLYGGAADTYRDTTSAQMEAKEATAEQILAENNLASAIEPVTTAWQGMKNELLVGILPAIEVVSGSMVSALEWMEEHPVALKAIAAAVSVLAIGLGGLAVAAGIYTAAQWAMNSAILANPITWVVVGIVAAIAAIVAIIVVVIEYWDQIVAAVKTACSAVISALQTAWAWISNLFMSVVGWINTNVIQPVVGFFVGLWNSVTSAFNSAIEWVKNAFSVAWEWIKNTPIFQFYSQLFNSIWATIQSVIDVIVGLVTGSWEAIKAVWGIVSAWFDENIIQPVGNFFTNLWDGIKNAASVAWSGIKAVWSAVTNWFNATVVNPVKNAFSNAWNTLKNGAQNAWNGIKSIFSSVASFFGDIFGKAWSRVKDIFSTGGKIFSGITEGITAAFKKVVNAIISGINKVVSVPFNAINKALDKIRSVSIAGIKPFAGLGSISVPQIPLLAQGGILTQPTLNIAGEAGPEAIIPIDKLQTYISSAIDKTMQVVNINALVAAVEDLANRPVIMNVNGRQFAVATASDTDSVNGNRLALSKRGLAL